MLCDRCVKKCKQEKFAVVIYCPSFVESISPRPERKMPKERVLRRFDAVLLKKNTAGKGGE